MKAVISTAQGIENVKVSEVAKPPAPTGDISIFALKFAKTAVRMN